MREVEIRKVDVSELKECVAVIQKGFSTVVDDFGFTRENFPNHEAFITTSQLRQDYQKQYLMYISIIANKIVGFVELDCIETEKKIYRMSRLTVLPEYRHLGIGGEMIDYIKKEVERQQGNAIVADIICGNNILESWYEQKGFKKEDKHSIKYAPVSFQVMLYQVG